MTTKAKESTHIKKMRRKIKTHIEEENKQITPEALEKTSETIHRWLDRHAPERKKLKILKTSNIDFDENKHPAKIASHYILHLQKVLKHNLSHPKEKRKTLAGRVTKR